MRRLIISQAMLLLSVVQSFAQPSGDYGQNDYHFRWGRERGQIYRQGQPARLEMNSQQFLYIKEEIRAQRFESDRLRVAKQVAQNHLLGARQVQQIMLLFSFESTRLRFAEFAYPYCVNPQDYYLVNSAFSFSSSISSLERSLPQQGSPQIHNGGMFQQTCAAPQPITIQPICHAEFMQLKRQIARQDFEQSRLQVACQAIRHKLLSAQQVREIMFCFDFESTKLDFAKFAYDFVLDRENYYVVNRAFDFSSSVQELDRYLYG